MSNLNLSLLFPFFQSGEKSTEKSGLCPDLQTWDCGRWEPHSWQQPAQTHNQHAEGEKAGGDQLLPQQQPPGESGLFPVHGGGGEGEMFSGREF